jgi:maltose-binding protein MalE
MAESREKATAQFVVILLTIVAFAIGAFSWAVNSHSDIKEWTSEQDFVTKKELKETIKEQYVPVREFMEVKAKIDETSRENKEVMKSLEEIKHELRSMSKKHK